MRFRLYLLAAFLVIVLTGCPPFEILSWSPNGRYLAFVNPERAGTVGLGYRDEAGG